MGVTRSDVEEGAMTLHVVPVGDLREHVEEGEKCWCIPRLEVVESKGVPCGWMVIHNAADGREQYETGQRSKH